MPKIKGKLFRPKLAKLKNAIIFLKHIGDKGEDLKPILKNLSGKYWLNIKNAKKVVNCGYISNAANPARQPGFEMFRSAGIKGSRKAAWNLINGKSNQVTAYVDFPSTEELNE